MTLIEFGQKGAELFSLKFMRNCLRNEAGQATRTDPPSHRLSQVSRNADG